MDSATPHSDPSGGQAPRLAKSSTALHFLVPPSIIGLQFGTFRPGRAGIEVDWGASFRTNDETGDWWDSEALSKPRNIIFVPMTNGGPD